MIELRTLVVVAVLAFSAGCVSNISEEGSPCPCGPGWECCKFNGVCLRAGEMCLTDEQKLLLVLEGTWVGTAAEAHTVSESNRVVMEMALPATGEPALEGLTGGIWFGEELETSPVDPDFPPIDGFHTYLDMRDGFVFSLVNMDFLNGRLLAEFDIYEQWKQFCEDQTEIYYVGGEVFSCMPGGTGWWSEGGEGPDGESGLIFHGPAGEEVFLSYGKIELCQSVCECDLSSCTVNIGQRALSGRLDLTVNIDSGVMIGTSSEGRIEAIKQ